MLAKLLTVGLMVSGEACEQENEGGRRRPDWINEGGQVKQALGFWPLARFWKRREVLVKDKPNKWQIFKMFTSLCSDLVWLLWVGLLDNYLRIIQEPLLFSKGLRSQRKALFLVEGESEERERLVKFMGSCFSVRIKAESPLHAGNFSLI